MPGLPSLTLTCKMVSPITFLHSKVRLFQLAPICRENISLKLICICFRGEINIPDTLCQILQLVLTCVSVNCDE